MKINLISLNYYLWMIASGVFTYMLLNNSEAYLALIIFPLYFIVGLMWGILDGIEKIKRSLK